MDYKFGHARLVMSTKTQKVIGLGIGAVAFLLVAIPILQTGVAYADNDHHDHHNHDHHHFHHFFHDIRFFRHHLDNHQINLLIRELEHLKGV